MALLPLSSLTGFVYYQGLCGSMAACLPAKTVFAIVKQCYIFLREVRVWMN